jgi:hypothetical protein
MGVRNYLIEGVSGSGKTSVAEELQRRGHHVVHGDRELAYKGDPATGRPLADPMQDRVAADVGFGHRHHLWDVGRVRALVADRTHPMTFFCGGSRNFGQFVDLFDGVFVLEVDLPCLMRRLAQRSATEFGGRQAERDFIARLHATKEDIPKHANLIDATLPVGRVADTILVGCSEAG